MHSCWYFSIDTLLHGLDLRFASIEKNSYQNQSYNKNRKKMKYLPIFGLSRSLESDGREIKGPFDFLFNVGLVESGGLNLVSWEEAGIEISVVLVERQNDFLEIRRGMEGSFACMYAFKAARMERYCVEKVICVYD